MKFLHWIVGSNPRPSECDSVALPTQPHIPLVVVGLVVVVVVHGRVLEAFDNLETYLNEFLVKNTHKTCAICKSKKFYDFFVVLLLVVVVDADGGVGDEYVT